MKHLNIFNSGSNLFGFRWIIVTFLLMAGLTLWYDLTGDAFFSGSAQQKWSSQGAGYHK